MAARFRPVLLGSVISFGAAVGLPAGPFSTLPPPTSKTNSTAQGIIQVPSLSLSHFGLMHSSKIPAAQATHMCVWSVISLCLQLGKELLLVSVFD